MNKIRKKVYETLIETLRNQRKSRNSTNASEMSKAAVKMQLLARSITLQACLNRVTYKTS